MFFQNTVPCFLTFYCSDQSLLFFRLKSSLLTNFVLHFVVGKIMYGYITVQPLRISKVEHNVIGANYFTGANNDKTLI